MKKNIFSFKLYKEGFRQTKILGIVLAVITVLGSALIPLMSIIEYYSNIKMQEANLYISQISLEEFVPLLFVFAFVAPIVMSLNIFSFMNKRNASDFYHSVPHTRKCIFISFSAVVLTWITAITAATILLNFALYSICPTTNVTLNFLPYAFFYYLAAALLVYGAISIAKAVTGTVLTNLVVTALIGLFPRFIMYIFSMALSEKVIIADISSMGLLVNLQYNIPVSLIFMPFTNTDIDMTFIGGIVYTVVLGIIYVLIGLLLFSKRKSETAERSAPNKIMQHVFRCLITIPVSLVLPLCMSLDSLSIETVILVIFISLIIYFGYELLTTKKIKNLVSAIPVLAVIVIFDILFGVTLTQAANYTLSITPEKDEIKEVCVIRENNNSYYGRVKYNDILIGDMYMDDEQFIEYVSEQLKYTANLVKENKYYDGTRDRVSLDISIRTKSGSTIKRSVLFTEAQVKYINGVYEADEIYKQKATELPEVNNESIINITLPYTFYDGNTGKGLWNIYAEEYSKLSTEEKLYHNGMSYDIPEGVTGYENIKIEFYGYHGTERFTSEYFVTNKTPKTLATIFKLVNTAEKVENVKKFIDAAISGELGDYDINLETFIGFSENQYLFFNIHGYENRIYGVLPEISNSTALDIVNVIKDIISDPDAIKLDFDKPIYSLSVCGGGNEYDWINEILYFNIKDEQFIQIEQYLNGVSNTDEVIEAA